MLSLMKQSFTLFSVSFFFLKLYLITLHRVVLLCSVVQSCPTLCNPADCSPSGSFVHEDSPSKNTAVGCHFFLQGIFLTRGLYLHLLCLLHCRRILYPLSPRTCYLIYVSFHVFPKTLLHSQYLVHLTIQ